MVLGTVVLIASAGCGESLPPVVTSTASPEAGSVSSVANDVTTSVEVSAVKSEVSPATQVAELPDSDTSPEDVCRLFMKYLNTGQRVKAERLLTSVAFDTTAKAGLYLQPMGGVAAEVQIQPAVYVTNKQQLAHVGCKITETVDGNVIRDELTWMVRKSKSGWRIFGMLLTMDEGRQDFLSLENAQDVDTILQMSGDRSAGSVGDAAGKVSLN
jgi:hypothetical protein